VYDDMFDFSLLRASSQGKRVSLVLLADFAAWHYNRLLIFDLYRIIYYKNINLQQQYKEIDT
jgi:hypothetical protein